MIMIILLMIMIKILVRRNLDENIARIKVKSVLDTESI